MQSVIESNDENTPVRMRPAVEALLTAQREFSAQVTPKPRLFGDDDETELPVVGEEESATTQWRLGDVPSFGVVAHLERFHDDIRVLRKLSATTTEDDESDPLQVHLLTQTLYGSDAIRGRWNQEATQARMLSRMSFPPSSSRFADLPAASVAGAVAAAVVPYLAYSCADPITGFGVKQALIGAFSVVCVRKAQSWFASRDWGATRRSKEILKILEETPAADASRFHWLRTDFVDLPARILNHLLRQKQLTFEQGEFLVSTASDVSEVRRLYEIVGALDRRYRVQITELLEWSGTQWVLHRAIRYRDAAAFRPSNGRRIRLPKLQREEDEADQSAGALVPIPIPVRGR